jgi:predicted nucleotidyltransferase component of viral defense system
MFTQTLPLPTAALIQDLKGNTFLNDFYLSGGTALSLQLGHRESEDLDFFNQQNFSPATIQNHLEKLGTLESVEIADGTLNCLLNDVKLQFLQYSYPLLEEFITWESIKLSSVLDIACTKLITVSMRGSKKDFIDIYVLLEKYSLTELMTYLDKKYQGVNYNHAHILKSLVFFEDADKQPMPRMHKDIEWSHIKNMISSQVKNYSLR